MRSKQSEIAMSNKKYTDGLNYDLIKRASEGDEAALTEILHIYEPYHILLCTRQMVGGDGKVRSIIDEDKKIQIEMHFVEAIKNKWRKLI